jgi:hypothetical protein
MYVYGVNLVVFFVFGYLHASSGKDSWVYQKKCRETCCKRIRSRRRHNSKIAFVDPIYFSRLPLMNLKINEQYWKKPVQTMKKKSFKIRSVGATEDV